MAYRWHPKNAEVDADSPRAWGTCDRCGFQWQLDQLTWQYSYQGAFVPMNTRLLVCPKHVDPLNEQDQAYILPPDPAPIFNARPENYVLDETSWMTTQDGDIITTQEGDSLITPLPNPSTTAVPNENSITEESAVDMVTEDGDVIVTESGDGNPINYEPNA